MTDTEVIELTLPVSKSKVVIRNYTTHDDDERSETVLYAGVEAKQQDDSNSVVFPIANVMASGRAYIPRLVQSIDGDTTNIANRLKELRSEDFAAIEEKVDEIVEAHSPKAKAVKTGSKATTSKS